MFQDFQQRSFNNVLHVELVAEAHLEVQLHELRLAVAAQVLVAETTCDLEVAVESAHHTELLELLRALGQHEELAGVYTRRHDVFAGAFGRSLNETRRIDFQTVLRREVLADDLEDLGAQHDVLAHACGAHIQVAVLQAQFLVDRVGINFKRRRFGFVQNGAIGSRNFNITGGKFGVFSTGLALVHNTRNLQHPLRTNGFSLSECLFVLLGMKHHLGQAVPIAQVDENQSAVVAAAVHPSAQGDGGSDMLGSKIAAGVCT